jgi:hypothetical protein
MNKLDFMNNNKSALAQQWKNNQPNINSIQFEIALAIVLSDATIYKVSSNAYIKFEQGYKQEYFIKNLFNIFSDYTWISEPGIRITKDGIRKGIPKSYWFKTFTHKTFTDLYNLTYVNGKKVILSNVIKQYIGNLGFTYWVIADGSLNKDNLLILHTQGFSLEENTILSQEFNDKFNLNSRVVKHKIQYYVIEFPKKDANQLHDIIKEHIIPEFTYKIPRLIVKKERV